jgi:hypothetical protein
MNTLRDTFVGFILVFLLFMVEVAYGTTFENLGASVRIGGPIGAQELLYRQVRFPKVKKAQEEMLGIRLKDQEVLEVAISCSGGGWRAMCCSTGFLCGAQDIGLLDTAMYISSLSGSTWLVAPWVYSGLDIQDYKKLVINAASTGIELKNPKETVHLMDNIWVKLAHLEHVNIVDFYGALLANSLLRGLKNGLHDIYLSDQRRVIDSGDWPMPIYTAILGEKGFEEQSFEFTPYEIGTRWLSAYIPTWAFGRVFSEGKTTNFAPEQYMGFMMGIFGSAFAASFKQAYDAVLKNAKLPDSINTQFAAGTFEIFKAFMSLIANTKNISDIRLFWAKVPNYAYKLDNNKFSECRGLKLADSGIVVDNPVFCTYRRPPYGDAPDIIFVFDSSATINFNELALLVRYAEKYNLKFPEIKEYKVEDNIIKIFKDDTDLSVPIIVYMPIVNGINLIGSRKIDKYYLRMLDGFCIQDAITFGFARTFNFDYTKRQAETLIAMTEFNILSVQEIIKQTMLDRIMLKRKLLTLMGD